MLDPTAHASSLLLTETDPLIIRERWMRAMMERFDAPYASIYDVGFNPETGELHIVAMQCIGSEPWATLDDLLSGQSLADFGAEAEHFSDLNASTVYGISDIPAELYEGVWKPFGIDSAVSITSLEDGRFAGNCNVFSAEGKRAPFDETCRRGDGSVWMRESLRILSLTSLLRASEALPRRVWILRPDGEVWMDNASAKTAPLSPAFTSRAQAFLASGEEEQEFFEDATGYTMTRVDGGDGAGAVVVAQSMLPLKMTEFMQLSRMQRVVSSYAARGATVDQIAQSLRRSRDTVKTHLANIYTALGIGSRAELSELYSRALDLEPGVSTPQTPA